MRPEKSHISFGVASRKSALEQGFFGPCCKSDGRFNAKTHDEPFMPAHLNEPHGNGRSKTYLVGVVIGLTGVELRFGYSLDDFQSQKMVRQAKDYSKINEPLSPRDR